MKKAAKVTLAGGCFWGIENYFRQQPGVLDVKVGYTGGKTSNPTYDQVCSGTTGHAEAVEIHFDPGKTSFSDLIHFFFRLHDPTTLNRQGNDRGSQYRSAIFYHNEDQQQIAERIKKEIEESGKWDNPLVTKIVPATTFWPAEDYHQQYLQKNPGGYCNHYLRD